MMLMLKYMLLLGIAVFIIKEPLPDQPDSETGSVILVVDGINPQRGGSLSAGIFTQEFFPETGKAAYERYLSVEAAVMEIHFDEIPAGEYAAAVFHDLDNNRELRTNFLGLPREPIGFSRDARIRMGPPNYDDAYFIVRAGETVTLTITLR
ncbi:MAG: DUF2141 domain-containing protein [Candidatus Cyclonatronum sp.]|uniref:DUF2141 domain-containing protein n=1 Tax=Cyclonatronum sp. TaxID=3024185 RepID=UPI0025BF53F2|nr:DUF2141 domain-containing protein [Cyclonatronum sp.]MCH8487335.1 DUF2141 domain-containing protein [Cyclonatronum sp.]